MSFKRLMLFWILVLIIIVIALIIILISAAATSCKIAESGDNEVSGTEEAGDINEAENQQQEEIGKELEDEEGELFFAEDYAKLHGVTVDEALRRFKLQDIAGKLSEDLITKEADTLAGYWIEHTPKFKLVILFTRDAEETIKPYLQKYKELADIIEVGTAKMSLVELQNVQEEVSSSIGNLGIPVDSEINVYENRVKVYVVDRVQFDSAVAEGRLALPDCVDVITVGSLAKPEN